MRRLDGVRKYFGFLLVILMLTAVISGCGSEDKYVKLVKSGSLDMAPNVPIGKAFGQFFANDKWRSFESTEGDRVVEFTGDCTWYGKEAKMLIQFKVYENTNRFEVGYVEIGKDKLNRIESTSVIEKVLSEYKK